MMFQFDFFFPGVSRSDVIQGKLGDCWLLSAIAILAMNKELFRCVYIPKRIGPVTLGTSVALQNPKKALKSI